MSLKSLPRQKEIAKELVTIYRFRAGEGSVEVGGTIIVPMVDPLIRINYIEQVTSINLGTT